MKCPFCGVHTDVPHDTEERCIEALNAEITRMRTLLQSVRGADPQGPPAAAEEPDGQPDEGDF
jgi:hypothetical protein